jgi:hypothetical protein
MGFAIFVGLAVALAALIVFALIALVRSHRQRLRFSGSAWYDYGPLGDGALVPVGPPRRPLSEAAVALPIPDPEPDVLDAYGREARTGETGPDALAS